MKLHAAGRLFPLMIAFALAVAHGSAFGQDAPILSATPTPAPTRTPKLTKEQAIRNRVMKNAEAEGFASPTPYPDVDMKRNTWLERHRQRLERKTFAEAENKKAIAEGKPIPFPSPVAETGPKRITAKAKEARRVGQVKKPSSEQVAEAEALEARERANEAAVHATIEKRSREARDGGISGTKAGSGATAPTPAPKP